MRPSPLFKVLIWSRVCVPACKLQVYRKHFFVVAPGLSARMQIQCFYKPLSLHLTPQSTLVMAVDTGQCAQGLQAYERTARAPTSTGWGNAIIKICWRNYCSSSEG